MEIVENHLNYLKKKKKRKKKLNPEFYAQCKLSFTNGGKIKTFQTYKI